MPYIIATERALFWAVRDAAQVIETGMTLLGQTTVAGLELVSHADENEFLRAVAGRAGQYKPLPAVGGWVEAGDIYGYGGGLVIVRQSHSRTEHAPETVPALFSVYRPDAIGDAAVLEWVANEKVERGIRRRFKAVVYECIQAHVTQVDWPPDVTPALWGVVQPPVTTPDWKVGVKYTGDNTAGAGKGDVVTHNGRRYRCWQTHTSQIGWEPPKVPALWIDLGPI
jgi:hypothetical protein